jgi:hypothetical protein
MPAMTDSRRTDRAIDVAWRAARDPAANVKALLRGAEIFTGQALLDESDALIARARRLLEGSAVESGGFLERLSAVNRTLREDQNGKRLKEHGTARQRLDSGDDFVLLEKPSSRTLVVVLATMFEDFWISLPVLQCYLATYGCSVLYLRDASNRMYLHGVAGAGPDFAALETAVRRAAEERDIGDVRILGFSSGGYAGLLLASRIGASAYLGFSIRTDFDPNSPLPLDRLATRVGSADDTPDLLLDLKAVTLETRSPRRGVLYYGEAAVIDAAHAEHMRDVPGFILKPLKAGLHNSVMTLLARNEFARVLKTFLS